MCNPCYQKSQREKRKSSSGRCKNHPERSVEAKGLCGSCYDRDLKSRNPEYKKRQSARSSEWARKNPDRASQARKKWQSKHSSSELYKIRRRSQLKALCGIELDDYELRYSEQSGLCAVCGVFRKTLCVDHCHSTGRVRGLLCQQCNSAIGLLGDNEEGVERALRYLQGKERG
ncbi:endonuclease domain-containing protein [Pseudomonas aeruginosa]|nr:endonuclease VII domain-containing protein [Pseudomonas aeruginosa]